jgi:ABC-type multidrug transport system fused ATPase/permease subunit
MATSAKKTLHHAGQQRQHASGQVNRWVTQSLKPIKEIKILGKENFFLNHFIKAATTLKKCNTAASTINLIPRYVTETIGLSIIVIAVIVMVLLDYSSHKIIVIMSAYGIAALRLLPNVNQLLMNLAQIRYIKHTIDLVAEEITTCAQIKPVSANSTPLAFKHTIKLSDIQFTYEGSDTPSLNQASLTITKGKIHALTGTTGAGKTTIVEILLGLLSPTHGSILLDDTTINTSSYQWRAIFGYIPQHIFLLDGTVKANIAFGMDEEDIDDAAVWKALEKAQIRDFVAALPEGLDTKVGEDGMRLSGGQRQRIGIARALYFKPQVLIMDEATSALDNETERNIMNTIHQISKDITIVMIAHRLSTIETADTIYYMANGTVCAHGTYKELFDTNKDFQKLVGSLSNVRH